MPHRLSKYLQSCETKAYIQKKNKTDSPNYRAISLIQVICNIIEKVVHEQINSFLLDESIIQLSILF